MCVDTHALINFRMPDAPTWNQKYMPHMCRDEIQDFCDKKVAELKALGYEAKWSIVPCQQCHECRLQRSRSWANRCVLEMEDFPPIATQEGEICRNWFVTLTYDEDHTTELRSPVDHMSLSLHQRPDGKAKDHLQMYMDSLRASYKRNFGHEGIRFFACGEYGDTNLRPHYHAILFNCPIPEDMLDPLFKNKFGHVYSNCELISDAWNNKGFAVITPANWSNAAYTARYIMKKQTGDNAEKLYEENGLLPPFVRMSRMPGIAANAYKGFEQYAYIDPDGVLRRKDQVTFKNAPQNVDPSFRPPRYFDKLLEKENPDLLQFVKDDRERCANAAYEREKEQSDLSDRERNLFRAESFFKHPIGLYRKFTQFHDGG